MSFPTRFGFVFLAFPLVTALVPAGGCNGEGEGMPCDTRAGSGGNNDCASGLQCTVLPNVQGARCCPTDRANATTPECSLGTSSTDAASPAPPDASGDGPAQGGEAGEAATGEASSEGGGDASSGEAGDGASSGPDGAGE